MWPRPSQLRLLLILLIATVASSSQAQVVREDFDVTDGPVTTMQLVNGALFIAGNFHQVGPVTGAAWPLDATTGAPDNGYPRVAGSVLGVASDGSGGWYFGGAFTDVGGFVISACSGLIYAGVPMS